MRQVGLGRRPPADCGRVAGPFAGTDDERVRAGPIEGAACRPAAAEVAAADPRLDARGGTDDQGAGRLVVAERVQQVGIEERLLLVLLGIGVVEQVAGGAQLPFLRGDHVLDQLDQDGAGVAALEAELAAEVAELALLAAAEPERAAAEAEVRLAVAAAEADAAIDRRPRRRRRHAAAMPPMPPPRRRRPRPPRWPRAARARRAPRGAVEAESLPPPAAPKIAMPVRGQRRAEHLQVLLQALLVDAIRDRDDEVGHRVGPDRLLGDGPVVGRDLDVVAANDVGAVDLGQQEPQGRAERDARHLRQADLRILNVAAAAGPGLLERLHVHDERQGRICRTGSRARP